MRYGRKALLRTAVPPYSSDTFLSLSALRSSRIIVAANLVVASHALGFATMSGTIPPTLMLLASSSSSWRLSYSKRWHSKKTWFSFGTHRYVHMYVCILTHQ
ncbi:uncharacterized protein LOC117187393 [Drosophila miranda]|uniref:uncharacterized protein LOC117187363 n=1 Tax=Drosophila miranda TaxID=7229 RepID=UPI00143F6E87|nr:uncharacterized protein LOC117187363 [Drosophila miranda]XP_033245874.1 uncharacterized protein LOC117187393 [Drosophila miranda]